MSDRDPHALFIEPHSDADLVLITLLRVLAADDPRQTARDILRDRSLHDVKFMTPSEHVQHLRERASRELEDE